MDGWGIAIFVAGMGLWWLTKKKSVFLFLAGIGAGILIGAIWAWVIINQVPGPY